MRPPWSMLLLLTVAIVCQPVNSYIPARISCRHHYLAGLETNVLPIRGGDSSVSHILCEMPEDYKGWDTVVKTEIHSGLERPHTVRDSRSVNFQVSDLTWLRETVKTSDCHQKVTVKWIAPPADPVSQSLTLVSLLNESLIYNYNPENDEENSDLVGLAAGIRHILPHEGLDGMVTVSATPLVCKQRVVSHDGCLFTGKVEVDQDPSEDWKWEISFRTDRSDQTLLTLHSPDMHTSHVRIENDYFLRIDAEDPIIVGQLSDTRWHTLTVSSNANKVLVQVDNRPPLNIAFWETQDVGRGIICASQDTTMKLDNSRFHMMTVITHSSQYNFYVGRVEVGLWGELLMIDSNDVEEQCADTQARRVTPNAPARLCTGCDCSLLPQTFQGLQPNSCERNEEDAFQLLRDADRLSLFYLPDGFDAETVSFANAITWKSDSDAGLLMFGFWIKGTSKGRWQVHYIGTRTFAVLCEIKEEESCSACSIESRKELGKDEWHVTSLWSSEDGTETLSTDRDACSLRPLGYANNVSLAEIYAVPSLLSGVGVFIGGTFYEKKKKGIYKSDMEAKFFENTREKIPSLRGCIKEVYSKGEKIDLSSVFEAQRTSTQIDPSDVGAYAIQVGCAQCVPSCEENVRCRSPLPGASPLPVCDCGDVMKISTNDGQCATTRDSVVPLSVQYLSAAPVVVPIETTKAVLSRVWVQVRIPATLDETTVIAEFNTHREMIARIYAAPKGELHVQIHPSDLTVFEATASHSIAPSDERVHLISLARRIPLGTRHSASKYLLYIDGRSFEVPDVGKAPLNNVSFPVGDKDQKNSIVIHDVGVAFDYNEDAFLHHSTNRIHQVDIHSRLLSYLYRTPSEEHQGLLDPYLWSPSIGDSKSQETIVQKGAFSYWGETLGPGLKPMTASYLGGSSPHGEVVEYTPDNYAPAHYMSARWLLYSLLLTALLCLLLLVCLCLYCCLLRSKSRSNASDRERMMRDTPDYLPVKMRPGSRDDSHSFDDGDGSVGTDDTDLNAYRDIGSHRVKIYRESMVSILVPSLDQPHEAAIMNRDESVVRNSPQDLTRSPEEARSPPLRSPPLSSPAPLVNVNEIQ